MSPSLTAPRPVCVSCAAGGGALLLLALLWSGKWTQGTLPVRLAAGLFLLALALLAVLLLVRAGLKQNGLLLALLPIGAAFFVRAACMDYVSYDYRDFLSQWAAFFRDNGGFAAIKEPIGDYNVVADGLLAVSYTI